MRAPIALLLVLALLPTVATAQSSLNFSAQDYPLARPDCVMGLIYKQDWDAIASKDIVTSVAPDQRAFCAFIGLAQEGPWRRYALVEFRGSSWCDAAGCSLVVFVEDRKGIWRATMTAADAPRAMAVSEGVAVDFSEPVEGLPAFGMPMKTAGGVDYQTWRFDAGRKTYARRP